MEIPFPMAEGHGLNSVGHSVASDTASPQFFDYYSNLMLNGILSFLFSFVSHAGQEDTKEKIPNNKPKYRYFLFVFIRVIRGCKN